MCEEEIYMLFNIGLLLEGLLLIKRNLLNVPFRENNDFSNDMHYFLNA